jgi:two-component system response regulator YesN
MTAKSENISLKEILDPDQLRGLFRHFSVVTGLDVALFDFSGREILAERKPRSVCESAKNCSKCREYIAYGGLLSSELGEPYICTCGCGLIMCSSPVMFNDRLAGSIACGPAILWDADDLAVSEFIEKTRDMDISVDPKELFHSAVSLSCTNMTSAAQILFIIVNSLTREHSAYLNQRVQINEQQARIAELIIDRKIAASGLREIEKRVSVRVYPVETEKELIAFVQSGNKQRATHILNDFLYVIFSFAGGNMDTIRVRIFELIAFLSRAAIDSGAPLGEVNRITKSSFEICQEDTDFERLCFLTTQAMERFIDTVYQHREKKKTSVHLTKAIEYIRGHYSEMITLNKVAGGVYVSEYYLSHLFRKEMNITFSDYVCKVRIEKAKELLQGDSNARIQEISEKIGFNDANYFAKIFKKLTGVSPKEYQAFFK